MTSWKALMVRVDKLEKRGKVALFDRVHLLIRIFSDPQFSIHATDIGSRPIDIMNRKVSDTCANFTELRSMIEMFPRKTQWLNGDISDMRATMLASRLKNRPKPKEEGTNEMAAVVADRNEQMGWKERCLKAEEENRRLRSKIRHQDKEISDLKEIMKGMSRRRSA